MPRALSVDELLELGLTYYRRQDYEKVLKTLKEATRLTPVPDVAVLDLRAAVYDKTGDFQSSLKDGRTMTKVAKSDSRGYLRVGKALQKLGKVARAREIYSYGLGNVHPSDKNYKALQSLHAKTQNEISPPRPLDPFSIFSWELAEEILGYLTFCRESCLRVSKGWRNCIRSLPRLWTAIDFSQARRTVKHGTVIEYIKCANTNPRRMALNRLAEQWRTLARLTALRNLETLELQGEWGILEEMPALPPNLKKLICGPGINIRIPEATQLMTKSSSLRHVEFHSLIAGPEWDWTASGQKQLQLDHLTMIVTDNSIHRLLNLGTASAVINHASSSLQDIKLDWKSDSYGNIDFQDFSQLKTLDLSGIYGNASLAGPNPARNVLSIQALPSSIRRVVWPPTSGRHVFRWDDEAPAPELTNLEEITFSSCVHISTAGEVFATMVERCTFLPRCIKSFAVRKPNVGDVDQGDVLALLLILCYDFVKLEHLGLEGIWAVDDEVMQKIIRAQPNIRRLRLCQMRVTGVTVKEAVQKLGSKLEFLALEQCTDISPDAVEWARKQGIEVVWSREKEELKSGRKIRHDWYT